LQHVEGRLFRPMALTVGFALLGSLLFSLSILPVLALLLFRSDTREWWNPILAAIIKGYRRSLEWSMSSLPRRLLVLGTAGGLLDDGTDSALFSNTEYFVDLKPKEQWRPVFHRDKEELIRAMDREVEKIPGAIWNFSQPIADNMEEAVSGVKGELAIKIFGT